ncbi:MAG: MFS transporter [Actinomycetota bacterium]|nr:MFS transporter [Actinomycetota bacterium]
MPLRNRLRGFAVDLSPLKQSRDYRLLFSSTLISETGRQITTVAVFFQIYRLTHSAAAVGLVGLVQLVALAVVAIGGGSILDVFDRRKMLIFTQFGIATSTALLVAAAFMHKTPVLLIYAAAGLSAGFSGLSGPTRSAILPNLVDKDKISSALALNQVMWNTTMLVGPAIAGVVIAQFGLRVAYLVDLVTYTASIYAALAMRPMKPVFVEGTTSSGFRAIGEGLSFLKGSKLILSTFAIDLIAMTFGMPRALFPILADVQFHRGAEVVGLLFAAPAAGGIIAAATSGWVSKVKRQGAAVLIAVALWGAGITAFGLVGNRLLLALFFLAFAGAADVVSAVFRSTMLQTESPDELRGRANAVHILVVAGGPRLGDFEAGLVAEAFDAPISVVSGGIACIVGCALMALVVPNFRKYRYQRALESPHV